MTSLEHFKPLAHKGVPLIKRDHVAAAFQRDLDIFRITRSFPRTLKWITLKQMLPATRNCPNCRNPLRVVDLRQKQKDGIVFKCVREECRSIKISIREGTIWADSSLTLMEGLRVVFYYFLRGFNALQAYRDLSEYNFSTQYGYV